MKQKLFTLFLALAASVGTISASLIKVDDNSLADWKKLPAGYVFESVCPDDAALLGLKSVKVYADLDYINILVEPNMDDITDLEWVPFHVYIDADNSDATGGYGDEFTDANADIYLEGGVFSGNEPYSYNPAVFKWWGEIGGNGWEWTDPNVSHDQSDCWGALICEGEFPGSASQFVDGKIEIQFAYHNIPVTWNETEFGIGFDIQQRWCSVGILPIGPDTEENPGGRIAKMKVKVDPVNYYIVDGIAYDFDATNNTCTVVYNGATGYSGNLVIPSNVTHENETYTVDGIGDFAFENCSSLTSVTIPNSVTSIGNSAFYGCSSLTSITIPNSVTSIGNRAFAGCSSLTSITIPNSVTSIGDRAFAGCSSLTSVTIPNSVTSIGNSAFYGCSSLTSITIPNSVTSIGEAALYGCSSLTSITIPNSVTSIGDGAFSDCYSLTSVIIGNSVTSIGSSAFYGCSSLTKVVWNAKNCDDFSFSNTPFYYYYSSYDLRSQITSFVFGDDVEHIPANLCYGMSNLTSITIPNSVTSIGFQAFRGCSSLTSITIPNSVTSIGEAALYGCSSLTSITIPNSVTSIGDYAFSGCSSLASVTIPNSVTSIGDYAFYKCSSLISIAAPATVFDIEEYKWQDYPKHLENVCVTAGELTENAFGFIARSYKTLKSLDLSATTHTELADEAFKDFYNLIALKLPANLTRINYMAVAGCKNLKSIDIPASVEGIDQSAFENCRSLTNVGFATNPAIKSIGNWAFYNCHALQSIAIPEGVEEIGDGAFYGCTYLQEMRLPASLRQMGDNAFALCSRLQKITSNAVVPPTIADKTFFEVSTEIPVYVPLSSASAYKADQFWGRMNIIGAETPVENTTVDATAVRKQLIDGQLFILRDGKTYTVQGQEVR